MRRHHSVGLALLVSVAIGAVGQNASAQDRTRYRYAQNTQVPPTRAPAEELPMGRSVPGQMPATSDSGGYPDQGFAPNPYHYSGGPEEAGGYASDCCDSCNSCCCGGACDSCGCDAGDCGSGGWCGCGGGRWFVTADYLNMRAHFSDALSHVNEVDTNDPQATIRHYDQLDFDYKSSFRVGGGYRLCCCGEELVFNYTQLRSDADDFVDGGDRFGGTRVELPFNPNPTNADPQDPFLSPTQSGSIHASVNVDSYDLEWRKTIPLGGTSCSDCGSPCGCGDCCKPRCPAWDITWSGGVRGAHVDSDRRYILTDTEVDTNNTDTTSRLRFDGAGPRFGVEGRRYFGCDGWFSIFMKGDISLLLGHLDLDTVQRTSVNGDDSFEGESLRASRLSR